MTSLEILYCTLGMCIVSYIPRVLPPLILSRHKIPVLLERWLKYVPTSVFGALVFCEIFTDSQGFNFSLTNINLLASLLVLVVAVRTHSLAKSIVLGLAAFWALQQVL
jgi:branched-subunit amino acid transport protein